MADSKTLNAMINRNAFDKWWEDEGQHLPLNLLDSSEAAWEACERVHRIGLVELSLKCRLEGMLAANREREAAGEALAYHDEAFQYLGQDAWRLAGMACEMPEEKHTLHHPKS